MRLSAEKRANTGASTAEAVVSAVARTLPALAQQRYREEWVADLAGSDELELSRWSVVGGAVMTAVTLDRTDPRLTGMTKAALALARLRWALALLGSAAVLGVGSFLWGGYDFPPLVFVDFAIKIAALVFVTLGLFALVGAMTVGVDVHGRKSLRIVWIGPIVILAIVVSLALNPFLMILGIPAAFAALLVALSGDNFAAGHGKQSTVRRVMLTLPFTLATLGVVVSGTLHIWVWNPLAAMPGRSLEQIYAAMRAAGESPDVAMVLVWGIFWGVVALVLPILCALPRLGEFFTARRIVVVGLLIISGAAALHFWAGFGMGMSLADAFEISGGDAAVSGPIIAILGQVVLVVALLFGPTPRAPRMPALPGFR